MGSRAWASLECKGPQRPLKGQTLAESTGWKRKDLQAAEFHILGQDEQGLEEPFVAAMLTASPEDGRLSKGSALSEAWPCLPPLCPDAHVSSDTPTLQPIGPLGAFSYRGGKKGKMCQEAYVAV